MSATETFFDTNVALYLVSPDKVKAARAETLIDGGGIVSVQVLNEVAMAGRRKFEMPWSEIDELLAALRLNLHVRPITVETHEWGVAIAKRHGFRVYDSMLLAAALLADCKIFYSEDLHDGQVIENKLTIRNPFGDA